MKSNEEENWEQQKTLLKLRFPELTDRDLDYKEGEIDQMLERISKKTGEPREFIHPMIAPKNEEVNGETPTS